MDSGLIWLYLCLKHMNENLSSCIMSRIYIEEQPDETRAFLDRTIEPRC